MLKRISPYFLNHKKSVSIALLSVIPTTATLTTLPLIFRELIDTALLSGNSTTVLFFCLLYFMALISHKILEYVQNIVVGFMGLEIVSQIKEELLNHILHLSVSFFDKNNSGILISRIESDAQKLYTLFTTAGLQTFNAFLNIVIPVVVMSFINIKLSLVVLLISPVYIVSTIILYKKVRPMFRKDRELYSEISGFLTEHLKAIPVLKSLNNQNWSKNKLAAINREKREHELKINILKMSTRFILMLVPQLAIVIVLYKSVDWISAGSITFGTVWMFIQYIQAAIFPLIVISEEIGQIQQAFGSAERIFGLLDTRSDISEGFIRKCRFNHDIRFNNVSFYYEKNKPILNNITFSIKKGSTVAIVGPTGSGKSTIIALLARFYDPIKGTITIDGINIKDFKFEALRQKVNLISQDIQLFPGNVTDNLRMFKSNISIEKVYESCKKLGVYDDIVNLPEGFNTKLANDGSNISFGESQLLSFSRAMTFNPEILIMDEATSSIDPNTEAKLQNNLSILLDGRTSIIVAHRLSTIVHADNILVIEKGNLVEQGSHVDLLNRNGLYADLHYSQTEKSIKKRYV